MAKKSKEKGKSFEREIAKFLTDLYNESFTRVPDSGAFTGGNNSYRKEFLTENQKRAHKGDLIPPDDWKFFNCELKSYSDFPFHHLFENKSIPYLDKWIEQTLQAEDHGDLSIIIMKFNRKGKFIAFKMPESFDLNKFIDYHDKNNNTWRITGFDHFFEKNKNNLKERSEKKT